MHISRLLGSRGQVTLSSPLPPMAIWTSVSGGKSRESTPTPPSPRPGSDPALHYLMVGVANRFDPSPRFGTREWLRDHPEVQAAGTNPLVHLARGAPPPA